MAAYYRLAGTGSQIVFSYADGRTVDVNHTQVVYGAGHFTEMTAAALFGMCFNLHDALRCLGQSLGAPGALTWPVEGHLACPTHVSRNTHPGFA